MLLVEAYNERKINQMRIDAHMCYMNANLVRVAVGSMFDEKVKFPEAYECFPDLFEKPVEKPKQQDWRIMKEILMDYATAINNK